MPVTRRSLFSAIRSSSRATAAAAMLTACMVGSPLVAQLQTQAFYPLLTDLLDATASYGPVALAGNPAPAAPTGNGVCVNGVYAGNAAGGQDVLTPSIAGLDLNDFQIDVDFNIAALPAGNRPILMCSKWYRWMGLYLQANGTVGLIYNNNVYSWSSTVLAPATWYTASMQFDNGLAALSINGQLVLVVAIGALNTGNYRDFTTNNWSNGTNFNGCIRNLRISNDTTINAAQWLTYGTGCVDGTAPGFYEQFSTSSLFDLSNTGVTMQSASPSYVLIQGAGPIVQPVSAPQTVGDDVTIQIPLPWAFPYQGNGLTNNLWVCSNGWVGLEPTTSTAATSTPAAFLSGPARVLGMVADLNPSATGGGTVHWEQDATDPTQFHVTFLGVPLYPAIGANDIQYTFHQGGTIELKWGACSIAAATLVGFATGNGQADPGPTDVSAVSVTVLGDGLKGLALNSLPGSRPILGTTFSMVVSQIPATAQIGAMIYSWTKQDPGIDLTSIGMAGCFQYLNMDTSVIFVPSGTTSNVQFAVPSATQLIGWHIYAQAAVLGSTATTLGAISSNGGDMLIDVN